MNVWRLIVAMRRWIHTRRPELRMQDVSETWLRTYRREQQYEGSLKDGLVGQWPVTHDK